MPAILTGTGDVASLVLAAGAGSRLRPLTLRLPKPLCPVGAEALVDLAIARARQATSDIAVNVHHDREALESHLGLAHQGAIHVSVEEPEALGTAGAVGQLRDWFGGRGALVLNSDAWCTPDLGGFLQGWDHERVRLLVAGGGELSPTSRIAACLLPSIDVAALAPEPSGLYERSWAPAHEAGRLEVIAYDGPFVDCGTPAGYLAANLLAAEMAGGVIIAPGAVVTSSISEAVVGEGATVAGAVRRSVIWPGATVEPGEILEGAIRAGERMTVLVR